MNNKGFIQVVALAVVGVVSLVTASFVLFEQPLDEKTWDGSKPSGDPKEIPVGASITTINGTDTLSDSRSVINTNFTNLNNALTDDDLSDDDLDALQNVAAMTEANGDILYYNSSAWQKLAKGSDGEVLKLSSGLPSWGTDNDSGGSGGAPGAWETFATNVLAPTNTSAGIFVQASSTIAASATTTEVQHVGEALELNGDYISDFTGS